MPSPDFIARQSRRPLLERLLVEKQIGQASFQMPGHKRKPVPDETLAAYWGPDLYTADINEINADIGYLPNPTGALAEALRLAAEAFGAGRTFFLVNGSTIGNIAAILSAVGENEAIGIARTSHRSVYGGLVMSGARPVYLMPDVHPDLGAPVCLAPQQVETLIAQHPALKAIHLTSPSYYGYAPDLPALLALIQGAGIAALVDEAHGSHFHFHPAFPPSAVDLKADLVIQSTHKTLTALTQASMLHHHGSRIALHRLEQVLATLQSSSPSSLLLASLDHARMVAAVHGEALLERALELAHTARQAFRQMEGVWCLGEESVGTAGVAAYDPTKLVIRVSRSGLTGYDVSQRLLDQHHLVTEFADTHQIICSITTADTPADVARLTGAVRTILAEAGPSALDVDAPVPIPDLPPQVLTPRAAFLAPSRAIPLVEAGGEIAAEYLIPYPPGIPLLVPGERITPDLLDYCHLLAGRGASFGEGGGLVQRQIRIVERTP